MSEQGMGGEHEGESTVIKNELPPNETGNKRIEPGFKRNLLIIGGVFAVAILAVVLMFVMKSNKKEKSTSSVGVDLPQSATKNPDGDQPSPAMKAAIKEKLNKEQKAAADAGQSVYVTPEILEVAQPLNGSSQAPNYNGSQPKPSDVYARQPLAAAPVPPTQEQVETLARRRAGMERQFGAMLTIMEAGKAAPARLTFAVAVDPAKPAVAAAAPAPGAPQRVTAQARGNELAGQLEIVPAEVASPIDSYKTNYASARIVAGKLAGAFLIGSIKQQEDGLQIQYSQMRIGNKAYQIDAIALDEKTSTNAMDASVDRRYLQRWVLPVAAAAFGGFATAASKTGGTVVADVAGTTITNPSATAEQARAAGVAAGMSVIQKEIDKQAAKPYQITMDANTPIGILFRSQVIERN